MCNNYLTYETESAQTEWIEYENYLQITTIQRS